MIKINPTLNQFCLRLAPAVAVFLALCLWLPPAWGQLQPASRTPALRVQHLAEVELLIFQFTNEERRKHGLPALARDDSLSEIARMHTDDMLRRHYFSHISPDGASPKERLAPVYLNVISRAGENIWGGRGLDFSDSRRLARVAVDGWMISPGHRANILNPDYTHLGVGVGVLGREIRATQNFVKRLR